jgi:very-short-patch-repair endonuclease
VFVSAPIRTIRRARGLRRELTLPEVVLWEAVRGRRLENLRFRRQHPIGPYVLDLYCASARLAVEVDGSSHDHPERARHDAQRDEWLRSQGLRVIRFAATDVLDRNGLGDVLAAIVVAAHRPSTAFGGPPPPHGGGGSEVP